MSRIGKKPIEIPAGVTVTLDHGQVTVKGPKGEIIRPVRDEVKIDISENVITLEPTKQTKFALALWGTYGSHLNNMIQGVQEPYVKKLVIEGVGYRAEMQGKTLVLSLGYSHKIEVDAPEGIELSSEKNTVTISGIDKEMVGQFAAQIRAYRKPEPYKGKGIRYENETVRRKEGKKSV
jgi:large subunit ribosomal protein L6